MLLAAQGLTRFATTTLATPQGLAVDRAGNVYVAENNLSTVEKFDTNGVASFFAYSSGPFGLAVDGATNVYVANYYDNTIDKYTPNGSGALFATAGLNYPEDLAFDSLGNLYAANGSTNITAMFDASGRFSVFVTNATSGPSFGPGLAIDSANNVYVLATSYATNIVKYSPAGVWSNFATEVATTDYNRNPQGMAFDSAGNFYGFIREVWVRDAVRRPIKPSS